MIIGLTVAGALLAATSPSADPCHGLRNCYEFGRADVTGDGVVDRVGYQRVGFDPDHLFRMMTAKVIVSSGDGARYTYDSSHRFPFEGPYGAAPIDGVPGAEIALSWLPGAHTSHVEVLTFRDGQLVKEKGWIQDGGFAYGSGVEWLPGETAETPIMRRCAYEDTPVGSRPGFRVTTIDFTWRDGDWTRGETDTRTTRGPVSWQCTRFAVPGMSKLPMNVFQ